MNMQMLMSAETLKLRSAALSDRGQKRRANEDAVFQFSESIGNEENIGLYLVCDGMGGHEAGDVASQLVVQTIVAALGKLLVFDEDGVASKLERPFYPQLLKEWLYDAILEANDHIRQILKEGSVNKMGTTVTALLIYNGRAYIANVGDSRTYLWRKGEIEQITTDHSMVNELLQSGAIPPEQAHSHQMRNIITQALNGKDEMLKQVDIFERPLLPGDRFLLCSDGLWGAYPDGAELEERIAASANPGDLCWQLVAEANQRDGSDNISAVAVFAA